MPGAHRAEVTSLDNGGLTCATAWTASDGTVLTLLGGRPALTEADTERLPIALLGALLRAEGAQQAAAGFAAVARDASRRATALARALDAARVETASKAAQLEAALSEAAQLNESLRRLNETLEERVAERTRALERETEERHKAEAALFQAQKMEAVGQLTGGVAHDFNNLLAVLMATLDLLEGAAGEDQRIRRLVETAQRAVMRGERLTQQLLAFARRQLLKPQIVDVGQLILESAGLLKRALGEAVELGVDAPKGDCIAYVDPAHFETALLNLAVNARDAMTGGGRLVIGTKVVEIGASVPEHSDRPQGDYVLVTVSDTGTGIPPDVLDRVFEPFFTTKELGKGTGLGLSQVYGFVKQSGGHIDISSAVGRGTSISIYLPLAQAAPVVALAPAQKTADTPSGSETVLVVEDDSDVLEMVLETLGELGYRTLAARNGVEAIDILRRPDAIDLVFTDLVMPNGKSGLDVAREARKRHPRAKILLTTGYTADPGVAEYRESEGLAILGKPYRPRDLGAKIREVLGQAAPSDTEQLADQH